MAARFVKVTPEMVERAARKTDWAAIDAMTDEDIERQVAENPDAASLMSDYDMNGGQARIVRKILKLSQSEFATRFRIPIGTLRDWEQGRAKPDGPALAYLRVIAADPEAVMRALAVHVKPPEPAAETSSRVKRRMSQ